MRWLILLGVLVALTSCDLPEGKRDLGPLYCTAFSSPEEPDMKMMIWTFVVALLLVAASFGATRETVAQDPEPPVDNKWASTVKVERSWVHGTEMLVEQRDDGNRFTLSLEVIMPTDEWTLAGEYSYDEKAGRDRILITGTPPKKKVVQQPWGTWCNVELLSVKKGEHPIEIWYRDARDEEYQFKDLLRLKGE